MVPERLFGTWILRMDLVGRSRSSAFFVSLGCGSVVVQPLRFLLLYLACKNIRRKCIISLEMILKVSSDVWTFLKNDKVFGRVGFLLGKNIQLYLPNDGKYI